MPDPSTRRAVNRYPVRNTYSLETWMDDAIIQAALQNGVTQADVVRACIETGLGELYGITKHGTVPGPQSPPQAPNPSPATDYTTDAR